MMELILVTFAVFVLVFAIMAIGVIFGRSPIRGSCGGLNGGDCGCTIKCERKLASKEM